MAARYADIVGIMAVTIHSCRSSGVFAVLLAGASTQTGAIPSATGALRGGPAQWRRCECAARIARLRFGSLLEAAGMRRPLGRRPLRIAPEVMRLWRRPSE